MDEFYLLKSFRIHGDPTRTPGTPQNAKNDDFINIFTLTSGIIGNCSITFFTIVHIAYMGCGLPPQKNWTPLRHPKGPPGPPKMTPRSQFSTFCQISRNLLDNFFSRHTWNLLWMSSIFSRVFVSMETPQGPLGPPKMPKMMILSTFSH